MTDINQKENPPMNKILGPDFSYTDALNQLTTEHLQKLRDAGEEFQKSPLRPSSAGKCERELAYEFTEFLKIATYEKDLHSPDLHRLFGLGHSVEYHVLNELRARFKEIGASIRYQQQSLSFLHLKNETQDIWVEGSIDFVIWSDKFKAIGDVKSKKEKFSSYRSSSWEEDSEKYSKLKTLQKIGEDAYYADDTPAFLKELNDPFLAMNVYQLNLYANNAFILERGIDHCVLLYYSKNTSRVRELRFRPSKELHDYVLTKFKTVFDLVTAGKLTETKQEFQLGSIKCAFCSYKKVCRGDDDPLRTYFKSLSPKAWPKNTDRMGSIGEQLEEMFSEFSQVTDQVSHVEIIEQAIIEVLNRERVNKVKLNNGDIYEVKLYKSPKEHFRLKRSKM